MKTPKGIVERLAHVYGVSCDVAQVLVDAGYDTPRKIRAATKSDLQKIKGIGPVLAGKLKERG